MKRLFVVALLMAGTLHGMCQRGGARGGGGLPSHGAPVIHGGMAPAGRSGFVGIQQFGIAQHVGGAPGMPVIGRGLPIAGRSQPMVQRGVTISGRGIHDGRFDRRRGGEFRNRRAYVPFVGVGVPYGFGGLYAPDFLGYPDSGFYGDTAYASPAAGPVAPPEEAAAPYDTQSSQPAAAAPNPFYRRPYERPQPPAPLEAENAVTLVFKDGRPSEQIRNYMLTRTTLYVQDEHRREISVDDLDLMATQKANKDAGIDFRLPGS
ncbi:MAG TPA: hypothetical protein VF865_16020 [Acidobacteriaceae bacterium]